jgi:prophage antirepressor-like protein
MNTQAIKLFETKKVRTAWNEEEEEWYFSVQDVVEILTDSVDVKDYIKKMKKRDPELNTNWGTICPLVEMRAADGKKRKIQASDIQGVFRIIQSIPSPKAEPFKQWLAHIAKERIDQLQDPELSIEQAMLAEATTTEISKKKEPKTFFQSREIAQQGGEIAGNTRKEIETKTGKKIISSLSAKNVLSVVNKK